MDAQDLPVSYGFYHCVVTGGVAPTCKEFTERDKLVEFLRERYKEAIENAESDIRLLVFQGSRLPVTGSDRRSITFPDGTVVPFTDVPVNTSDHMLTAVDRARLGVI